MDLFTAEHLNGKLWNLAKQGAFLCFVVSCALLGASLVVPGSGVFENAHLSNTVFSGPPPR
jgi:hypothetical protein